MSELSASRSDDMRTWGMAVGVVGGRTILRRQAGGTASVYCYPPGTKASKLEVEHAPFPHSLGLIKP